MNRFVLRLKIALRDRTAGICYLVSAVVILALLMGLDSAGEERSAIPIGLAVHDDSSEAEKFVTGLKNTPAVYVTEGEVDELKERLLDGLINCIFVVDEGFGEKIRQGFPDEIITVISGEDDRMSVILSDITAASIMYDIAEDDIDGCISYSNYIEGNPTGFNIILFDSIPGGAGNVKRIADSTDQEFRNFIRKCYEIVKNCTCGDKEDGDSSCYSCLRSYRNQYYHQIIKRRYAIEFLGELLGENQ